MRVTHPFHPLAGREFRLAMRKHTWGERRVFVFDEEGQLFSFPAGWTDADPPDPFVAVSAGRSLFRVEDLLELAALIERLRPTEAAPTCKANYAVYVRAITPCAPHSPDR